MYQRNNMHRLLLPSLVHNPRAVCLPLLDKHLILPLRYINSIHPPTWLDTESSPCTPRRRPIDSRHIDILARVKLERRLGTVHLEVDLAVWVVRRDELVQGRSARVDGDGAGVLWVEDKDVVDVGFGGA